MRGSGKAAAAAKTSSVDCSSVNWFPEAALKK